MSIKHRTELIGLMPKRKLVGAEIGVASGLNSNDMLVNWNVKMLYLVDNWITISDQKGDAASPQSWHDFNLESTKRIMKNHKGKFKILQGMSIEMSKEVKNNSLDFIYIDGDHSYEGVMNDLKHWVPKVKKGGLISGHDYLNEAYGVFSAVSDFCADQYTPITIPEHKTEDAGFYFIKK